MGMLLANMFLTSAFHSVPPTHHAPHTTHAHSSFSFSRSARTKPVVAGCSLTGAGGSEANGGTSSEANELGGRTMAEGGSR